jgi:Na+/H+ antiporter NhaD/arsenite permease-like protein
MLLIRPYLRANQKRQRRSHLPVFFIFVVSNIGGALTPLGDPPLYLGFLEGVPFEWTLGLWPVWLVTVGSLLIVFYLYDRRVFVREDMETPGALREDVQPRRRLGIEGKHNVLFLGGVMVAVMLGGHYSHLAWIQHYRVQDALILLLALISWFTTPRGVHEANHFHFHPIAEVAAVFAGIFITMIPALEILRAQSLDLGITEPWQYFWMSGTLSSFLDNAPTYLAFTSMASGLVNPESPQLAELLNCKLGVSLLRAISAGSVFMGANTYIGNGPNFMVKSIAERHGVPMPSFGGYMIYSGLTLIPIFALVTLIFFR